MKKIIGWVLLILAGAGIIGSFTWGLMDDYGFVESILMVIGGIALLVGVVVLFGWALGVVLDD